ncbi:hypothetical protein G5V59_20110 [Nocardioides sp. W3-2-3]|nr:hypothetical protein [Nocardioides convexus]
MSGLFILTFAPKAFAATDDWYSKTSPLIAWEDDAKQALAYGTAYTKNTYLKNHTFYRDPRAGGDAVYTESSLQLQGACRPVRRAVGLPQRRGPECPRQQRLLGRPVRRGRLFPPTCQPGAGLLQGV